MNHEQQRFFGASSMAGALCTGIMINVAYAQLSTLEWVYACVVFVFFALAGCSLISPERSYAKEHATTKGALHPAE